MFILIFFLLTLFYLIYMVALVVAPNMGSVVIIIFIAIVYVFYFGVVSKKPESSLYAFLLIYLFFPTSGNSWLIINIDELVGITLSIILQNIAALAICLQLMRTKSQLHKYPIKLQWFCIIASVTLILAVLSGGYQQLSGIYLGRLVTPEELVWPAPLLYGIIFLYGCINYITDIKKLERLYFILILSGISLILEVVFYYYLGLPLPLAERAVELFSGRFNGVIRADYVTVGELGFYSIGCFLYFIYSRKMPKLLILSILFFLPIIATYQRGPAVSGFLVIVIFLLLRSRIRPAQLRIIAVASLLALIGAYVVIMQVLKPYIDLVEQVVETSQVRPDYLVSFGDSGAARVGAYVRGLDVFAFSFPFGVGSGQVPTAMGYENIHDYFGAANLGEEAQSFYWKIRSFWPTGPHNYYINLLAEYGLLGAVLLWLFIYSFVSNLIKFWKERIRLRENNLNIFYAKITAFATLIGTMFWWMYYHYALFPIVFLLFFVTFYSSKEPMGDECL